MFCGVPFIKVDGSVEKCFRSSFELIELITHQQAFLGLPMRSLSGNGLDPLIVKIEKREKLRTHKTDSC